MSVSNNASVPAPIFDAVPIHNGVYRVLTEVFTVPWSYHPHYHKDIIDIICLTPGFQGFITINGVRYPIKDASVYWIPPKIVHSTEFTKCSGGRQIVVLLKTEFLHRALESFTASSREAVESMLGEVAVVYGDSAMVLIDHASSLADFHAMVEGVSRGDPAHNAVGDARALLALWHGALRHMLNEAPTSAGKMY